METLSIEDNTVNYEHEEYDQMLDPSDKGLKTICIR